VGHNLERYGQKAREPLLIPEGVQHRTKRPAGVEATFGNIKQDKGFRRIMLSGKQKVEIETGLIAIEHNLSKFRIKTENCPLNQKLYKIIHKHYKNQVHQSSLTFEDFKI
jgi:hypothetical protein